MQKRNHQIKVMLNDEEQEKLNEVTEDHLSKAETLRKCLNEKGIKEPQKSVAVERVMFAPLTGSDADKINTLAQKWKVSKAKVVAILVNRQLDKKQK